MNYPVPRNERLRLQVLKAYALLDSQPEKAYDDYTYLASTICEAPIALISLVDEDRQWFKSRLGLDVSETPRDVAFCAHTILEQDVMTVQDALKDERFADNPLVTGDPGIRFYVGAPLTTHDGYALGTLCAIDRKPRSLTATQKKGMAALARQLMMLIESRRTARELLAAMAKIKTMEGLIPVCSYCKDIRKDSGFWSSIEEYLREHSAAELTHGICPDCLRKHFPEEANVGA